MSLTKETATKPMERGEAETFRLCFLALPTELTIDILKHLSIEHLAALAESSFPQIDAAATERALYILTTSKKHSVPLLAALTTSKNRRLASEAKKQIIELAAADFHGWFYEGGTEDEVVQGILKPDDSKLIPVLKWLDEGTEAEMEQKAIALFNAMDWNEYNTMNCYLTDPYYVHVQEGMIVFEILRHSRKTKPELAEKPELSEAEKEAQFGRQSVWIRIIWRYLKETKWTWEKLDPCPIPFFIHDDNVPILKQFYANGWDINAYIDRKQCYVQRPFEQSTFSESDSETSSQSPVFRADHLPRIVPDRCTSSLHFSTFYPSPLTFHYLLSLPHCDINASSWNGTALHNLLNYYGCNGDSHPHYPLSPSHILQNNTLLKALLTHGANPNPTHINDQILTHPLDLCFDAEREVVINEDALVALLEAGADVGIWEGVPEEAWKMEVVAQFRLVRAEGEVKMDD